MSTLEVDVGHGIHSGDKNLGLIVVFLVLGIDYNNIMSVFALDLHFYMLIIAVETIIIDYPLSTRNKFYFYYMFIITH